MSGRKERIVYEGKELKDWVVYPGQPQIERHGAKSFHVVSAPSLGLMASGDTPKQALVYLEEMVRTYLSDLVYRGVAFQVLGKKGWAKADLPRHGVIAPQHRVELASTASHA